MSSLSLRSFSLFLSLPSFLRSAPCGTIPTGVRTGSNTWKPRSIKISPPPRELWFLIAVAMSGQACNKLPGWSRALGLCNSPHVSIYNSISTFFKASVPWGLQKVVETYLCAELRSRLHFLICPISAQGSLAGFKVNPAGEIKHLGRF